MGKEISSASFNHSDFKEFEKRLQRETDILNNFFAEDVFDTETLHVGVELEGCLMDERCDPVAKSEHLIEGIDDKNIVPELAKYNFEINTQPIRLGANFLGELHQELNGLWQQCCLQAEKLDISAVSIGILPTYHQKMLTYENIYPFHRYYALEAELAKYRGGKPICADIEGVDHFKECFNSVLLESVTTSLQIHVQMSLSNSNRIYNAAQIISAPMIAVSANSPFLFGRNLWSDTRIPIFEQAAVLPYEINGKPTAHKRVSFGHGFVENSLMDFFQENLNDYLVLLPELMDEDETSLYHLRLHNGTIWRWNRPIIGMDNPDKPNLRVEHRVNPAGPSIADNIANVAFFLGLLKYYSDKKMPPESEISFDVVAENFYSAAKSGLGSDIVWLNKKSMNMMDLIDKELLPNARIGLVQLGIDKEEIDYYLNIIKQRVYKRQNGSAWQRKFIEKYGLDFNNMLYHYFENQTSEQAVYQWKI